MRGGLAPAHDEVIARLLAKAPSERHASAAELAAAIRDWPVTSGAVTATIGTEAGHDGGRAPDADAETDAGAGAEADVEREIGRTEGGRLVARRDARVGRPILVEERDAALEGADLVRVQALAAAGGPNVQRVLALSDDRRSVIYEAIPGAVVGVDALSSADQAALIGALQALREAGAEDLARLPSARVALTAGGPVLLIAPVPRPG